MPTNSSAFGFAPSPSGAKMSQSASKKRKMDSGETKYYAVRAGHKPGVYTTWAICQQQISGFKGAVFKSFLSYEDASAFVAGRDPPSMANDKPDRFYGVAVGRKPGVYTDWSKAQQAIVGWKGPKYRKFDTHAEALAFVRAYRNVAAAPLVEVEGSEEEEPPTKRAKTAARSQAAIPVVYTDGSSLGNGRAGAAAGVGVFFGTGDPRNISERLVGDPQTNQRAELTALLRTLEVVPENQSIEIRTDSKYSIQCVTEWYINWQKNGWRTQGGPVKNKDLVVAIRARLDARQKKGAQTQFTWVKGHASDPGNIAADYLAVEGARKRA
ncbi:ribonuclease H-like domain-containing protein [Lasiosphaeria miniovina]|uniref:Ribonuclease H n=1 Tax=Lasiosphaeria miniovina TaxID=1954250 RepID=A0AA40BF35_9PEZI|nr:ribonuclease H-like domain-containing protein [Lasiosphaeria miniovina]KAK0733031.1 ribonuclease H-like domain-containing protein [Lasiosphaeria miniovina]